MDVIALHRRATAATTAVLDRVAADKLGVPTPCTSWTISEIVDHMVSNGHTMLGRLGQESTSDNLATLSDTFLAAYDDQEVLDRTFELAGFEVDGRTVVAVNFADVLVHGWDIARAAGFDVTFDDDLAEAALRVTSIVPDSMRGPDKAFDHARDVAQDASPHDRLIAFVGRDLAWSAS
ncbi:TIGR03086 family protein [Actinophytocola xinjiangensis]|uniref:TIGR03086 family protein n=1 Tax=Actinophytocola xinjiangensis TaxID=485602 RepID=A0A7Z1AXN8_9PSEU|nr:TIGR03086 family metal-binding protein [Actinophytocola xinjiangensis]OLF09419.1 TIGR03086 family protein [Actinophytocola xinjiangensis]